MARNKHRSGNNKEKRSKGKGKIAACGIKERKQTNDKRADLQSSGYNVKNKMKSMNRCREYLSYEDNNP